MHAVTFQDFVSVAGDVNSMRDLETDAIEFFAEKIAIIREIDPNDVDRFTFRELLLYNDSAVLMGCLPYLRMTTDDGIDDDCDPGPAAEFLGQFHPAEAAKLGDDPESLLAAYDFNYDGTGPEEMLSDDPVIRTGQLKWLLCRCGDDPADGLKFYIRERESVHLLDIDNRNLPDTCRHKRFYRCRFDVADWAKRSLSGCEFSDCEIVELPEDGLWGCTFVRPRGRTPRIALEGGRGNLVMK